MRATNHRRPPSRLPLLLLLTVTLGVLCTTRVHAQLIAYDGFDYAPAGSDLMGKAGGVGFTGPWYPGGFNASIHNNYDVATGSLAFGNLLTSGGRVTSLPQNSISGLSRNLGTTLGVTGTTRYMSVLLRPEGTLNNGAFSGFYGLNFETLVEPQLFLGKPGGGNIGQYVLENRGGAGQMSTGVNAVSGQTALLVIKSEFLAGNDRFTLYVNPTPGAPEPAFGTVKQDASLSTFNTLTIYSTGAFSLDELRVGNTFADVVPVVPEPAGLVLGGSIILLALGRRRTAAQFSPVGQK